MLSGIAFSLFADKHNLSYIYADRYCVPMDDQRPISGAEQAFFSLGTGRGIFSFSFCTTLDNVIVSSACCADLHQV